MAASENSRESTSSLDEEARLEALEKGVRRRQGMCQLSCARPSSACCCAIYLCLSFLISVYRTCSLLACLSNRITISPLDAATYM